MGRVMSDKEKRLQRKLIPFNIVAIIIALVCIFSFMFTPIIKIDAGKILRDDSMITTLNDAVGNMIGGESTGGGEGEEGEESGGESSNAVMNYLPLVTTVLSTVFKSADGSLTISAQTASKVAFASESEKSQIAMDELLFGENAVIGRLIDSIIKALPTVLESDETKALIEEELVRLIATSFASNLTDSAEELINDNIDKLTDTLKKLEQLENGASPDEIADEFVEQLSEILEGTVELREADKETIRDYLIDSYNDTLEHSEEFSVEALIAVAISSNVDISSLFGTDSNSDTEGSITLKSLTDEEVGDGDEGEVVPPENEPSQDPSEDDPNGGEEPDPLPHPSEGENDRVICTTYTELWAQLGFDLGMIDELSVNLRTYLQNLILGMIGEYTDYLSYYGYIYYAMLGFAALWALMAIFAFIHIFLKNKRFAMWYVKLLGGIPALIWVGLAIGKLAITKGWIGADLAVIGVVLGGISSAMWICGLCYLLLWAISLFWAFPIKRKIKKERRAAKEDAKAIKGKRK